MSMDYKHRVPGYRNRQVRKPKQKRVWLIAVVAGVAIGLSWLSFEVLLRRTDPTPETADLKTTRMPAPPMTAAPGRGEQSKTAKPESAEVKVPARAKKPPESEPTPKLAEPRFSFYKILPEKEVIIPESEIKTIKRAETLGSAQSGDLYLLQAGSFANRQDAEKLKAQLAQLRVKAKIESVKIENVVWYRVKIGPFDSLVGADKVRSYLRIKQIDSVVQKATRKK